MEHTKVEPDSDSEHFHVPALCDGARDIKHEDCCVSPIFCSVKINLRWDLPVLDVKAVLKCEYFMMNTHIQT